MQQELIDYVGEERARLILRSWYTKKVRDFMTEKLGSENAADCWLRSTRMGYPTTAQDMIDAGMGDGVLDELERQYGPSPHYS